MKSMNLQSFAMHTLAQDQSNDHKQNAEQYQVVYSLSPKLSMSSTSSDQSHVWD